MLARRDLPLSIYSDCESLVNTINTYMHRSPLHYEIQYFQNKSLLLRILKEIRGRPCTTTSTHVKAHQRDNQPTFSASPSDSTSRHQEYNKIADRLAKTSFTLDGSPLVPDENTYLAPVHAFSRLQIPQPLLVLWSMKIIRKNCSTPYIFPTPVSFTICVGCCMYTCLTIRFGMIR